ncbi:hypothetical protein [Vibrio mexicanus]|uniref:hypothetical protein n=1 Tax=Vibrio mexicanus TaxID=1004326 RepID=UPI00063C447D|nr:hypothetical protein [Vibrio mexicanus]
MISTHRDYVLEGKQQHAHFEINPAGELEVEIIEEKTRHRCELDQVSMSSDHGVAKLVGHQGSDDWQLELRANDAKELFSLIAKANEEYEILMRDLC